MPVLGSRITDGEDTYAFSDRVFPPLQVLASNGTGPVTSLPFPLIPDFTDEQSSADIGSSLHDRVSGNAWLLQRIVGKIHLGAYAAAAAGSAAAIWNNVYVTAGILVARAADENQAVCDLSSFESDPQQVDNAANPWVWRRSWILGNPLGDNIRYPQTNTGMYGALGDGPHIDSKVKRFITREHRLWMVVSARGFDGRATTQVSGPDGDQPFIAGTMDLRVYGTLRRSKNSSAF